jgi:hypothetical protein
MALRCARVVGVIGESEEGKRMSVQRVISLSKSIHLCSYVLVSFLQLESNNNGSIPQPSVWFPILDRATMQYHYSKQGSLFMANSWQHRMISTL